MVQKPCNLLMCKFKMCSRRIIEKNNFSVTMTTIPEIVCVNALISVMSQLLNINYLKETIMHIFVKLH